MPIYPFLMSMDKKNRELIERKHRKDLVTRFWANTLIKELLTYAYI